MIMTVGLIVLLVGQRPELAESEGRGGPGKLVQIVGHSVAWSAAAVLTVRMIRSARSSSDPQAGQPKAPQQTNSEPNEPNEPNA
jgi:hypothetical protein